MMQQAKVKLTAELIEAFAGTFLSPMYDNPQPTPDLHRICWDMYCSPNELVAIAAPREHAKSTALTHDFGLAVALFRVQDYIIVASATEDLAIGHLGDIAKELRENDALIREFKIKGLSVDSKTDIICDFQDGHQCRFVAKGSGQKMRGMKWNGKRPGLILCDDLEEDEQVENLDRRRKFRKWFYRALLPCRRRGGLVRFHGTILHEDALLARVTGKNSSWLSRIFKAHKAFDDFSDILWPEQFPVSRLKAIRQAFIDDGDATGYSQEYLNDPLDHSESYLKKADFLPMMRREPGSPNVDDYTVDKMLYVGADFAVSKDDSANRTSFTVGGTCHRNLLHIVDQEVGRWDSLEWIEKMFEIQERHQPEVWFVEDGVIWKTVSPMIYKEMLKRNFWLNLQPLPSTKDKAVRGRPLQKRMRAHSVRFDKEADWYPGYEEELLRFTAHAEARLDDQFDSTTVLVRGLELTPDNEEEDFEDEEEVEMRRMDPRRVFGRNATTGY